MATSRPARPRRQTVSATTAPAPSTAGASAATTSTPLLAGAKLVWVEPGLHSLVIAPARTALAQAADMALPAIHVTSPGPAGTNAVKLVSTQELGSWIGAAGGSVVLQAPPAGGHILVTAYTLAGQLAPPLDLELLPIGTVRPATPTAAPAATAPSLPLEILLHIEREGDRRFGVQDWAGRIGSRQRIEAMAVRPLEQLAGSDIEYKAYTLGGRETPWVTDGRLCGTRGQSLPLTGFAVRLAAPLRDRFEVAYRGSFFVSGPVPAVRNGEPCFAPMRDDPLEAISIRITQQGR